MSNDEWLQEAYNAGLQIGQDPEAMNAARTLLDGGASIVRKVMDETPDGEEWFSRAKAELIRAAKDKGDRQ